MSTRLRCLHFAVGNTEMMHLREAPSRQQPHSEWFRLNVSEPQVQIASSVWTVSSACVRTATCQWVRSREHCIGWAVASNESLGICYALVANANLSVFSFSSFLLLVAQRAGTFWPDQISTPTGTRATTTRTRHQSQKQLALCTPLRASFSRLIS